MRHQTIYSQRRLFIFYSSIPYGGGQQGWVRTRYTLWVQEERGYGPLERKPQTTKFNFPSSLWGVGVGGREGNRERERTVKKPLLWNLNKSSQNEGKHLGLQLLDVKECLRVGCPCISPRVSIFRVATQSFFNSGARTLLRKPWPWRNMKLFEEHSEREGRVVKDEVRYRDKSQTI